MHVNQEGNLFHTQKIVYKNLLYACFHWFKQGPLIREYPLLEKKGDEQSSQNFIEKKM